MLPSSERLRQQPMTSWIDVVTPRLSDFEVPGASGGLTCAFENSNLNLFCPHYHTLSTKKECYYSTCLVTAVFVKQFFFAKGSSPGRPIDLSNQTNYLEKTCKGHWLLALSMLKWRLIKSVVNWLVGPTLRLQSKMVLDKLIWHE